MISLTQTTEQWAVTPTRTENTKPGSPTTREKTTSTGVNMFSTSPARDPSPEEMDLACRVQESKKQGPSNDSTPEPLSKKRRTTPSNTNETDKSDLNGTPVTEARQRFDHVAQTNSFKLLFDLENLK